MTIPAIIPLILFWMSLGAHKMESEMILIGAMASFILGLQFYGIKQMNKLCERVTALEVKVSNLHAWAFQYSLRYTIIILINHGNRINSRLSHNRYCWHGLHPKNRFGIRTFKVVSIAQKSYLPCKLCVRKATSLFLIQKTPPQIFRELCTIIIHEKNSWAYWEMNVCFKNSIEQGFRHIIEKKHLNKH